MTTLRQFAAADQARHGNLIEPLGDSIPVAMGPGTLATRLARWGSDEPANGSAPRPG